MRRLAIFAVSMTLPHCGPFSGAGSEKEDGDGDGVSHEGEWAAEDVSALNQGCATQVKAQVPGFSDGQAMIYCSCVSEEIQKRWSPDDHLKHAYTHVEELKTDGTIAACTAKAGTPTSTASESKQSSWPVSEQSGFLSACTASAKGSGVQANVAGAYCPCMLDIVITRWTPSEYMQNADANLGELQNDGSVAGCMDNAQKAVASTSTSTATTTSTSSGTGTGTSTTSTHVACDPDKQAIRLLPGLNKVHLGMTLTEFHENYATGLLETNLPNNHLIVVSDPRTSGYTTYFYFTTSQDEANPPLDRVARLHDMAAGDPPLVQTYTALLTSPNSHSAEGASWTYLWWKQANDRLHLRFFMSSNFNGVDITAHDTSTAALDPEGAKWAEPCR